jgi:outer membrane protein TolC
VSYRPAPLPQPAETARPAALDMPRLRVQASELHHPLLRPTNLDLAGGLDPDQAAVLAVLLNPDLRAARQAHGEAQAQLVLAGLLPNPELAVEVTHPTGGSEPLVTTASLGLSIDVQNLVSHTARRDAGRAELEQVDLGIAWQEWVVAQQARLLAGRLAWLRERSRIVRDEILYVAETAGLLERASEAGDATLPEVSIQRTALGGLRRLGRELEQGEQETVASLLALFGRPDQPTLETAPPVPPIGSVPKASSDSCLEHRLDIEALRRGYEAQEQAVRLAIMQQFPALSIGLTGQRNESRIRFLGGFVTFSLPALHSARPMITAAEATRTRLRSELEARAAAARAEVAAAGETIVVLARQLAQAREAVTPLAASEARQRDAVARGDVGRLAYQEARSALADQKLEIAALSQALVETRVAFETACGSLGPTSGGESK